MQTTKGHAPIQNVLQAAGISATHRTLSSAEGRRAQAEPIGWPSSEKGPRKRRESMRTFRDKENSQLGFIRRVSRRYSIGMMSGEEEERWIEPRDNSVERLQEKKNMRRGMTRAASMPLQSSPQHLKTMGEIGDDHARNDDHREERGPITCVIEDSGGDRPPTPTPTPVDDVL